MINVQVTYAKIRDSLKSGDMVLCRDSGLGSLRTRVERLIVKHGTASPYTHTGVVWKDLGRVWVMEMTTHGCAPHLLSTYGDFVLAYAPEELTEEALNYAHSQFGELTYSKWQAILGQLKHLTIGQDKKAQCAEYAISIWQKSGMPPTDIATPGACSEGAMLVWNSPLVSVKN